MALDSQVRHGEQHPMDRRFHGRGIRTGPLAAQFEFSHSIEDARLGPGTFGAHVRGIGPRRQSRSMQSAHLIARLEHRDHRVAQSGSTSEESCHRRRGQLLRQR
jgi:hypothetical protein